MYLVVYKKKNIPINCSILTVVEGIYNYNISFYGNIHFHAYTSMNSSQNQIPIPSHTCVSTNFAIEHGLIPSQLFYY